MMNARSTRAIPWRIAFGLIFLIGAAAGTFTPRTPVRASDTQTAPATFEVHATPDSVGQLDFVYITGSTVMDGAGGKGAQKVKLTVSLPNRRGSISVLVPVERADGLFSACFSQTNVVGTYFIRAISPGGGAIGHTRFVVETGYDPPDEDAKLGEIAVEFEQHIEKLAETLPPSPAREDMQIKLNTLRVRLTDGMKQIKAFNTVLKRLYALFLDYAQDRAAFAPVLHALDRWSEDARKLESRIAAEMSAAAQASVRCDDVSRIAQDLQDMADLLASIETPMKEVADFEKTYKDSSGLGLEDNINCVQASDTVDPGKLDPKFEEALKKLDPADEPAAYMAASLTIARDTLAAASDKLFAVYCEQFQGPFSAHMHADLSDHGKVWWSYDIYAEGTLSLRYVKGAGTGKSQQVTGEFDGDITRFAVRESALDVLFPKLKHDAAYWHNDAVPAVPQHFRLPVSGTISSDRLIFKLDASSGQIIAGDNNAAMCSYVLVSPYLMAPLVQTFTLPYKSMQWVVSKALADQPAALAVHVDRPHSQSYVERTITNARRNPGAVSTYDLHVKACNPSCAGSD